MKFLKTLRQPADNSPLILFRIAFGLLLMYLFLHDILSGYVYANFVRPPFTFSFIGFQFLRPLPGNGMYYFFGAMVLLSLMVALGAWYRPAMVCLSILWTATYLMQKSGYNNHYYLVVLLCWLMIFLPANRYYAVDVKRKAVIETDICSRYCLLIFVVQSAIIYFFAAISKLTSTWFSGKFIGIAFSALARRPVLGLIYGQRWFQLFVCYGGFFFDLLIVPLLLWRRTRKYAFIVFCLFHLFNSFTFNINIFPYLSIALVVFFFDGSKIRRLFFVQGLPPANSNYSPANAFKEKIIICCLGIYFFFQLIIPMRSWLYPGNVFWNEEGYRMSWKMMIRSKNGTVYFKVIDTVSHKCWKIDPSKIFTPMQVTSLAISPDIIWQYSQRIKADFAKKNITGVKVYAIGQVSLNRSKPMPLVDTTVDLASVKWHPFRHSGWITKGPEE